MKARAKTVLCFSVLLSTWLFLGLDYEGSSAIDESPHQLSIPSVFVYDSGGRRDPFVSLVVERVGESETEESEPQEATLAVSEESEYVLLGLVWDKDRVLALVKTTTGKWIVGEGSFIDEFLVSEINTDKEEVVLTGETEIIKLRMRE